MFNVTTATEGEAGAVLVRAVEPLDGIDRMRKRRNQDDMNELCSGPGKLCEAFGIQKEQTGTPLTEGALRIEDGAAPDKTTTDTRIGVSGGEDMDLRYLVPDSDYLSRQPRN